MTRPVLLLILAALSLTTPARSQDRADVAPSQIIGNRELPKVLYIVPWKKPQIDPSTGRPPTSVIDEVLAPLDRDVYRRQLRLGTEPAATASAKP